MNGKRGRLEKSFDGWQLGLAVVLSAWALVMIIVPRPASPLEIPTPIPTPSELDDLRSTEARREMKARSELTDVARALGSAVRGYGRAEARHDTDEMSSARQSLVVATSAMLAEPPESILLLRALQTATFIAGVRHWEATGAMNRDVEELGGGLLPAFRDAGWSSESGGRTKILMNDDELGAAYRKRWSALVALKKEIGASSLTEEKLLFAFSIKHARAARQSADVLAERALGARNVLRRIDDYARRDPSYPADFARGVALFGARSYGPSHIAFNRHLAAHPDGPLTLRAQNFGRAAMIGDSDGVEPEP